MDTHATQSNRFLKLFADAAKVRGPLKKSVGPLDSVVALRIALCRERSGQRTLLQRLPWITMRQGMTKLHWAPSSSQRPLELVPEERRERPRST